MHGVLRRRRRGSGSPAKPGRVISATIREVEALFRKYRLYQGLIQDWRGDRNVALYSMFVAHVWQPAGFFARLFSRWSAGRLADADRSLSHRRRANRLQVFRCVTLPALRPSIAIVVLSIINSLKAFDIVYGMTQGGPAQSTQMLALWPSPSRCSSTISGAAKSNVEATDKVLSK